jgi:hypothetical protein
MPATRPDALPPIDVGAWLRVGGMFQGSDTTKLNDWRMDHALGELHAGGKVHKNVGVTLNLVSDMLSLFNPPGTGMGEGGNYVAIEDAIISFDFMDEFHFWAGHLLVPVDRSNASGPFFMIPWNYPGFMSAGGQQLITAPQEGPFGRNNGAVVWGDINGGQFTYLAGVFDNANRSQSPLFSGRLRLALLDKEGGFWGNGSYFGEKDLLTIGVGGQFQNQPDGTKDYSEVNADVLFEKKLGGGSFVTVEGAFYRYFVDAGLENTGYIMAAYATPTMGVGSLQPMARYQFATFKGGGSAASNIDVGVSYLIKGPALRVNATYGHTDLGGANMAGMEGTANSIQLGAQAIFF